MSNQPKWKCVGNLGDADPITYGGILVYIDETGVYPPEVEVIEEYENPEYDSDFDPDYQDEDEPNTEFAYDEDKSEELHWQISRVVLDRCTYDPETGVLSDNKFHPQHSAWWSQSFAEKLARPQDGNMDDVCFCQDVEKDELIRLFCSDDPLELAEAYRCVAGYHGWGEFDQYTMTIKSKKEMVERYKEDLAAIN